MMKPQDVVVVLKLAVAPAGLSYARLAEQLQMSPSEVHAAVKRAADAGLLDPERRQPRRIAVEEFLIHGLKYVFPARRGALTRGWPTGRAAAPLAGQLAAADEPPPVWPDPAGPVRGYALAPLYRSVPQAVARDAALYELLALVDALRDGRARERALAVAEVRRRLAA